MQSAGRGRFSSLSSHWGIIILIRNMLLTVTMFFREHFFKFSIRFRSQSTPTQSMPASLPRSFTAARDPQLLGSRVHASEPAGASLGAGSTPTPVPGFLIQALHVGLHRDTPPRRHLPSGSRPRQGRRHHPAEPREPPNMRENPSGVRRSSADSGSHHPTRRHQPGRPRCPS